MTLVAFVLGAVFAAALLLPIWRAERRRIDDLLHLLESKAAPVEFATYVRPPDDAPNLGTWLASEDGLIVYRLDDEDE